MNRILTLALMALFAVALTAAGSEAATKKQKKAPNEATTQSQQQPKPENSVYGAGCKNQGASIMSGGCVN